AIWLRRGTVTVQRRVSPLRAPAGTEVRVDLTLTSEGSIGSSPLLVNEALPDVLGDDIRLTVDPGGRTRSVAYVFKPKLRGRYDLGPLELVNTDPFGAIVRTKPLEGTAPLIVYPSYEHLGGIPTGVQRLGAVRHSPRLGQGDEFYSLRPYETGDDLRRVHWTSSAKLGELVVRQDELLGEPRAIVIVDTCASKHRGEGAEASIEAAVSACASVGVLALEKRIRLRVFSSDGPLVRSRRVTEPELMEALALLQPSTRPSVVGMLEHVPPRQLLGAALVIITPGLSQQEMGALARFAHSATGGAIVHILADTFAGGRRPAKEAAVSPLGLPIVRLAAGESLRQAWGAQVRDVPLAR
ncbi:MAG TPA: DUF58 domain-containing protein, partial [Actinomycetota bacterium]|nr:DUF58 domain-containing protein [Actinomycetota bacterium]